MPIHASFEVQGHRGAGALLPENTLASFELALDLGVTSIETDVHLTRDDVPVLVHDACINDGQGPLVRSLTLQQLRSHRLPVGSEQWPVGSNQPSSSLLPTADCPLATAQRGIPTLTEFFEFVAAYTTSAEKTRAQQEGARRLIFDIELKRVPFEPETVGDGFTGNAPALLERLVLAAIQQVGVLKRARVRSFDHRSVWAIKQLEPTLETAILIYETVPMNIGAMLAAAQADIYCPDFHNVDAEVVRQVHAADKRIIPYTVNEPRDWERLIAWGVDGITTDYPDRLLAWLDGESVVSGP
ncbi:MAG: hypothetical protein EXR98_11800 [Gemmataceae bacterium]|nr:hypothetical protein [Gemmataceae bacterium]